MYSFLFAALSLVGCVLPLQEKSAVVLEAGEYSLQELVAKASAALDINYSVTDAEKQNLQRRISFTAAQSFSTPQFRLFFEKNLLANGFALDPVQGVDGKQFRVVDLRGNPMSKVALRGNAAMVGPEQLSALDGRAIVVTVTFALQYQDAQRLQSSLRQYLGDTQLEATFNIGSNALLVTSYPSTVLAVAKLIKTVDVAPAEGDSRAQTVSAVSPKRVDVLEKRIGELEAKVKALESR